MMELDNSCEGVLDIMDFYANILSLLIYKAGEKASFKLMPVRIIAGHLKVLYLEMHTFMY